MSEKIKISVVMPSFNEEKAVSVMIDEIKRHTSNFDTEILLVDSSSDGTAEMARAKGARVIYQKPQGHGAALKTGLYEAANDIIITSDCDNTYPMDFIPKLVALMSEYDIISCNRLNKNLNKEMPMTNKFGNWSFAFLVRSLYGINTHDVTTGMFCMKRSMVHAINLESNYSLPCEIIIRSVLSGFKHKEIDIPYKLRIGETTLNKWRSGKAYLKCIFKHKYNLNIAKEEL